MTRRVSVVNKNIYQVDVNAISVKKPARNYFSVCKSSNLTRSGHTIFLQRDIDIFFRIVPFAFLSIVPPFQFRFPFCFSVHAVEEERKLEGTTVRKESIILENGVTINKND